MQLKTSLSNLLRAQNIRMKDPEVVWQKVQKMADDGIDKIMFISDFDCTLSRYKDKEGNRCVTTHAVIQGAVSVRHPELAAKAAALDKKYIAIEYCPIMEKEEKIPHMIDWWQASHEFAVQATLSKQEVADYVKKARILLRNSRDHADLYMKKIEENALPHIVFSAGVGDIIENVFKNQVGYIPKGLHIISNMMVYDENDICTDFTVPLIHTFNKNSTVLNDDMKFYQEIKGRNNVFLLGDSLGDSHMDVGVRDEGVALKIGFLNFNFDTLLDKYMEHYDIVVLDDQSMDVPLQIFDYIVDKSLNFENAIGKNGIDMAKWLIHPTWTLKVVGSNPAREEDLKSEKLEALESSNHLIAAEAGH